MCFVANYNSILLYQFACKSPGGELRGSLVRCHLNVKQSAQDEGQSSICRSLSSSFHAFQSNCVKPRLTELESGAENLCFSSFPGRSTSSSSTPAISQKELRSSRHQLSSYNDNPSSLRDPPRRDRMVPQWPTYWFDRAATDCKWGEENQSYWQSSDWG